MAYLPNKLLNIKSMRYLALTFLFSLLGLASMAQTPNWEVNSSEFEYSMSFSGVVVVDAVEVQDTADRIAAWIGGELRGTARPFYAEATGRFYYFLLVYSNEINENVTFSFYDDSENVIVDLTNQEVFVTDKLEGGFSDPYIWSTLFDFKFDSFDLDGINDSVWIDETLNTITITVDAGTNVSAAVAVFSFYGAVKIEVNGVEQESGVTVNDFSDTVVYEITTTTGEVFRWDVVVNIPTGLLNDSNHEKHSVYPNPATGSIYLSGLKICDSWQIMNLMGDVVMAGDKANEIDVSPLINGLYVVIVSFNRAETRLSFNKE